MSIRYSLVDNKLTPDPQDCRAQVNYGASVGIEEIATAIARAGSTVTKAEILAFWEEFCAELERQVLLGNRVVLDLFVVGATLEGVFTGPDDSYDSTRHRGRVKLAANTRLRRLEALLEFVKGRAASNLPVIDELEDFTTDAVGGALTVGGVVRLRGERLKYDLADPEQGVFLVDEAGQAHRIEKVKTNKPREQLFVLPANLRAGTYRLEVRVRYEGSQNLRTGAYGGTVRLS